MFRVVNIVIYIFILTLGTSLFFNGFFNEKGDITLNKFDYRIKDIGIDTFKLDATYDKVVFFLIDSLRLDFLNIEKENPVTNIHNRMKNMNSLMKSSELGNNVRFYNFKACFPTLTSFRIKAMMTGENPGFFEIVSTLNPRNSETSSNILKNLNEKNSTTVVIGDETWSLLFEKQITRDYKYKSLDIRDFDALDNYTIDISKKFLNVSSNDRIYTDWKFLVMHYIGIDHIGHSHGVNNELIRDKLTNLDIYARDVILKLLGLDYEEDIEPSEFAKLVENHIKLRNNDPKDKRILFLLFGDHGQSDNGSHGGPNIMETSSGLFVFSNVPFKKKMIQPEDWSKEEVNNSKRISFQDRIKNIETMTQIDIVPVLSTAFGISIPENNLGIFNVDFLTQLSGQNLRKVNSKNNRTLYSDLEERLYFAKIIHNNAIQLYKKFLNKPGDLNIKELKELFSKFKNSYELFKSINDNFENNSYVEDINNSLRICDEHLSISLEFSKSLRNYLFKDRSSFDWINIFEGLFVISALLIFLLIIIVPKMNPNNKFKFWMDQRLFIAFVCVIFIATFINLMEIIIFTELNVPEKFIFYSNILVCTIILCFIIYIIFKFRMEIKSFYVTVYTLIFYENESIWSFYWFILTILCLTQFASYSAGFIKNENKVVRFLLSSNQILLLFSGLKINLKEIILPILQLFLIRITYFFDKSFDSNISEMITYNEPLTVIILIIYLSFLLFIHKSSLKKRNIFLICVSPIYVCFNWINNIFVVRLFATAIAISAVYDSIKNYRSINENNSNHNEIDNKWVTNQLIILFMLKNQLIIPYCISNLIQLIAIENLNTKRDHIKNHTIKGIENVMLLYLTSINNFYNLGNRLSLDSIPEYVGLIGLDYYHPLISHLLVIYFLTSHLNSLNLLLKLPAVRFKNARTLILAILLSRFLTTIIGIMVLRHNHLIWQLLAPKLLYEFVFNVAFSVYSLYP